MKQKKKKKKNRLAVLIAVEIVENAGRVAQELK
jgi:hypothetical protein